LWPTPASPDERFRGTAGRGWSLRHALGVLGAATVATAFVTETLVGSLEEFAQQAHLSEFFGCDRDRRFGREHHPSTGSAVLLAARGELRLAARDRTGVGRSGRRLPESARGSVAQERIASAGISLRLIELASIGGAAFPRSNCSLAGEDVAPAWDASNRGLWRVRRGLLLRREQIVQYAQPPEGSVVALVPTRATRSRCGATGYFGSAAD
jgi:hypothetical protein